MEILSRMLASNLNVASSMVTTWNRSRQFSGNGGGYSRYVELHISAGNHHIARNVGIKLSWWSHRKQQDVVI
jgi:hypothetical protein